MKTDAFNKISALRRNAAELETFWERYQTKCVEVANVDKHGAKFGGDARFKQFNVHTFFESHAGTYGSSSCHTFGSFSSDVVEPYIVRAMNVLRKELFETAAQLMRKDAATLVDDARKEVETMNEALEACLQEAAPDDDAAERAESRET